MYSLINDATINFAKEGRHHSGFIVSQNWFNVIKNKQGRPQGMAIMVYADIVDWFMPILDKSTGYYTQKFSSDKLKLSYSDIANKFDISKDTAKDIIKLLKSLNLINIEFRTITVKNTILNNVLFIGLNYRSYIKSITRATITPPPLVSPEGLRELSLEGGGEVPPHVVQQHLLTTPNKENKIKEKNPTFDFTGFTEQQKLSIQKWLEYKREIKKTYKSQTSLNNLRNHFLSDPDFMIAIEWSISQGYQGLFYPSNFKKKNDLHRSNSLDYSEAF